VIQLSAVAYSYRDGIRFNNGQEILLQQLEEGQQVDVLCLALADPAGAVDLRYGATRRRGPGPGLQHAAARR
jgi:hypothetical protein